MGSKIKKVIVKEKRAHMQGIYCRSGVHVYVAGLGESLKRKYNLLL